MPQPGHQVQIDVKFVAPIAGVTTKRYYQYTAIDDCTRLRILKIFERNNQRSAIQFLDYVCERLPFRVERVQTDNGGEFQKEFHWHVLEKGISHVFIKPRTPRLNGKVERSHHIDKDDFYSLLRGVVIDSSKLFNEKIRECRYRRYSCPSNHGTFNLKVQVSPSLMPTTSLIRGSLLSSERSCMANRLVNPPPAPFGAGGIIST